MTVELPKDAEGREIPLDTVVLYDKDGKRREVDWYTFYLDRKSTSGHTATSCDIPT